MKLYGSIAIPILLLGILFTQARSDIPTATPDDHTILRFDPPALELKPGAQGEVTVLLENVQGLYGLEVHLSFDPAILEVIDSDPNAEGVQIQPAGWWQDGFVAVNRADNASGRIDFAATLLRPAKPVSGRQAAAVITFAAKKDGRSPLRVEAAILSTRNAVRLPYARQEGLVEVSESGQAAGNGGAGTGRKVLAAAGAAAFLAALGVFLYALRRRRGRG